jgi:hypothetical protein
LLAAGEADDDCVVQAGRGADRVDVGLLIVAFDAV